MAYPPLHPNSRESLANTLAPETFRSYYPGESQYVEFKQGVSENKIAEAIGAFSNAEGGVILIGVGADGTIHGINVDGEAKARIHRVVAKVHDPGRYDLHELSVGGKQVVALAVAPRHEGFAQTSDGRVLVRRDAMNTALIGQPLQDFVAAHALRRFETTPVGRNLSDADPQHLHAVSEAFGWRSGREERLVDHELAVRDGDHIQLTVAGALYLLDDPSSVLGKSYIEVFRYRDEGPVEDKRYSISGPLPRQVENATAAISGELGHDIVLVGVRRHELERVPLPVLREAIANAVAHRVYEDHRRAVQVEIRPARVEIISPGPLPEPVTVENLRDQNAARNLRVIALLRRFRLAEDAGRGIDLMEDEMAARLLDPPRFAADTGSVTVTLPLTSTVTTTERAWVSEVEARGEIRPRDRILVVHAARRQSLTNSYVRDLLGVDSTHARAALHRLCDAQLLRQEGTKSGARYVLDRRVAPPPGLRLSEADMRGAILDLAVEGPVTNETVRRRLSLDRTDALRLLTRLVEGGALERRGERRGSHYVLRE